MAGYNLTISVGKCNFTFKSNTLGAIAKQVFVVVEIIKVFDTEISALYDTLPKAIKETFNFNLF